MQRKRMHLQKNQQIALLIAAPFAAFGLLLCAKEIYAQVLMPHMQPCILRTLTGLLCPACGMTHSVFAVCRLDFVAALHENVMIPASLLVLLLWYAELWCRVLGHPKRILPRKAAFWWAMLAAWLVYAVLRNII